MIMQVQRGTAAFGRQQWFVADEVGVRLSIMFSLEEDAKGAIRLADLLVQDTLTRLLAYMKEFS